MQSMELKGVIYFLQYHRVKKPLDYIYSDYLYLCMHIVIKYKHHPLHMT